MGKNKFFIYILMLTGFFVAGCAAFFSIKGIGMLFAGATIAAMLMASSLELAKVVLTSFLYRFWDKVNNWLKIYLLFAVVILMGITSLGIFGFLSAAYQKSASEYGVFTQQIVAIENQKKFIDEKIDVKKKRISDLNDSRSKQMDMMSKASTIATGNNLTSIRKLQDQNSDFIKNTDGQIKSESFDLDDLLKKDSDFELQINKLKADSLSSKDIQTFKFIADAFNTDLNTVVKYFILAIIIVFDPLAVGLVLSYNIAIYGKMNKDIDLDIPKKIENSFDLKNEEKNITKQDIKESPKEIIPEIDPIISNLTKEEEDQLLNSYSQEEIKSEEIDCENNSLEKSINEFANTLDDKKKV